MPPPDRSRVGAVVKVGELLGEVGDVIRSTMSYPAENYAVCETGLKVGVPPRAASGAARGISEVSRAPAVRRWGGVYGRSGVDGRDGFEILKRVRLNTWDCRVNDTFQRDSALSVRGQRPVRRGDY